MESKNANTTARVFINLLKDIKIKTSNKIVEYSNPKKIKL